MHRVRIELPGASLAAVNELELFLLRMKAAGAILGRWSLGRRIGSSIEVEFAEAADAACLRFWQA